MVEARNRRAQFEPSKASEVRAEMANGTRPSEKPAQAPKKADARRDDVSSTTARAPQGAAGSNGIDDTKREAVNVYTKGWRRNLLEVFFQASKSAPQDPKKSSRRRRKKKTN